MITNSQIAGPSSNSSGRVPLNPSETSARPLLPQSRTCAVSGYVRRLAPRYDANLHLELLLDPEIRFGIAMQVMERDLGAALAADLVTS